MRTPAKRDLTRKARERLAAVVRTRRDHPDYVGVRTHETSQGVVLDWHDTYAHENGILVVIPRTMDYLPTIEAVLEELHCWRRECDA